MTAMRTVVDHTVVDASLLAQMLSGLVKLSSDSNTASFMRGQMGIPDNTDDSKLVSISDHAIIEGITNAGICKIIQCEERLLNADLVHENVGRLFDGINTVYKEMHGDDIDPYLFKEYFKK